MFHPHHMIVISGSCTPKIAAHRLLYGSSPMSTKKLLMFAAAGLLTPAAIEGTASAEVTRSVMIHSPLNDKAPVTGTPARLKRTDEEDIKGLTTAATIWLTAAVGAAVGAGHVWLALIGVLIAYLILSILLGVDTWLARKRGRRQGD